MGKGVPIGLAVEGATRQAMQLVRATIERSVVARTEPTAEAPHGMGLDKGDAEDEGRERLAEFGCTAHSTARGAEATALHQEVGTRARRWVVERNHRWMHRFRRILVRWAKSRQTIWPFCISPVP